ncbi:MAG: energy transducer TonB [Bryobacteraceae bacterium]
MPGTAKVELLIGTSGKVVCLKVADIHPLIKASVERALTSWQFKPAIENGKLVAYLGRLEFFLCNILCGGNTTGMTLLK